MKNIGVFPLNEFSKRRRLFKALSVIFEVSFLYFDGTPDHYDALICFNKIHLTHQKTLLFNPCGCSPHPTLNKGGYIRFENTDQLDYRLRNQAIYDSRCDEMPPLNLGDRDLLLATYNNQPLWKKTFYDNSVLDVVSIAPEELGESGANESSHNDSFGDFFGTFRYQLNEKRFFSYLPTIHFLREVVSDDLWVPPPLRASFLVDDPNIRWRTYGKLKYHELIEKATKHNFHLSIATIPLDLFWASRDAVRLVNSSSKYLSLAIHGNNHLKREMLLLNNNELAFIAQALKRVSRFEKKYNVAVSRVFVPPHESFSEDVCRAMVRLGVEGLCNSRPFGWVKNTRFPLSNLNPYIGWYPCDFVSGGLPVITRRGLTTDFVLRAFLDQPLITYFHQSDLNSGLNELCDIADRVNNIGDVKWGSLDTILRSNYAVKHTDSLLRVKMYSRKVEVCAPDHTNEISVQLPMTKAEAFNDKIVINNQQYSLFLDNSEMKSEPIVLANSSSTFNIELVDSKSTNPSEVETNQYRMVPYIRRIATEMRDRFMK